MFTKRVAFVAMSATLALVTCGNALAGVAVSSLVGGVVNHLEDQDFETLINNAGGSTTVDVGDYLVGMVTISTLAAPPGNQVASLQGGSTFTGVFLIEVATKGGGGGSPFTFTFKPAPGSAWTAFTPDLARVDPGTMLVMYEDNGGFPNVASSHLVQNGLGLDGSLDTAQDGTGLWEFGFTATDLAGDPIAAAGEFWDASSPTDDVTAFSNTPTSATAIQKLLFSNALNITEYLAGPLLDKHDHLGFGTDTHLQTFGTGESIGVAADVLPVFTESDLYIKPSNVPEPSSVLIWTLFGLVAGGCSWRKIRRNVAA